MEGTFTLFTAEYTILHILLACPRAWCTQICLS